MKTYESITEWLNSIGTFRFWVYKRPGIHYDSNEEFEFVDDYCHYGIIKDVVLDDPTNPLLGIEEVEGDEERWEEDDEISIIEYYRLDQILIRKVKRK